MQSEHLSNLHVGWVVGGWLIAAAVTAALYRRRRRPGLRAARIRAPASGSASPCAAASSSGGLMVGMRWSDAPILHGAAITFFSVLSGSS